MMAESIIKMKEEKGMVMIESLLVYIITIMLLYTVLFLFSLYCHNACVQMIANDVAVRAASNYSIEDYDPNQETVSAEQVGDIKLYRYFFNGEKKIGNRLQKNWGPFALEKLLITSPFRKNNKFSVKVEMIHDGLSSNHIKVTITQEYFKDLVRTLRALGINISGTKETIAYADCVDMIDYLNTVDYTDSLTSLSALNSSVIGFVNSLFQLFTND